MTDDAAQGAIEAVNLVLEQRARDGRPMTAQEVEKFQALQLRIIELEQEALGLVGQLADAEDISAAENSSEAVRLLEIDNTLSELYERLAAGL